MKALEMQVEKRPKNMQEMMNLLPSGAFKPASRKTIGMEANAADKKSSTILDNINKTSALTGQLKQTEAIKSDSLTNNNVATTALDTSVLNQVHNAAINPDLKEKAYVSESKTIPQNHTFGSNATKQPNTISKAKNKNTLWIVSGILIFILIIGAGSYLSLNQVKKYQNQHTTVPVTENLKPDVSNSDSKDSEIQPERTTEPIGTSNVTEIKENDDPIMSQKSPITPVKRSNSTEVDKPISESYDNRTSDSESYNSSNEAISESYDNR